MHVILHVPFTRILLSNPLNRHSVFIVLTYVRKVWEKLQVASAVFGETHKLSQCASGTLSTFLECLFSPIGNGNEDVLVSPILLGCLFSRGWRILSTKNYGDVSRYMEHYQSSNPLLGIIPVPIWPQRENLICRIANKGCSCIRNYRNYRIIFYEIGLGFFTYFCRISINNQTGYYF